MIMPRRRVSAPALDPAVDEARRKAAADRQRRRRARKQAGEIVVEVLVSRRARDVLVDARWLGTWDEDEPEAIREAVQRLIDGLQTVTRDAFD